MDTELSDLDLHEAGACGGVGDLCPHCDEAMAARIKAVCRDCCHDHDQRSVSGDEVQQTTPGHADYCDCRVSA